MKYVLHFEIDVAQRKCWLQAKTQIADIKIVRMLLKFATYFGQKKNKMKAIKIDGSQKMV